MSRLAGKVAIVTGGAGGIGAATAHELAREGAAVAVVDIDEAKANEVADEIRRTGAHAIALGGDLAEEDVARSVVQATVAEFGRVDVLHNNAALTASSFLSRDTTVSEMSLDVWQRSLQVNLGSQLLMCKYAVPEMRKGGGGSIVNMSSGAALSGDRTRSGLRRLEGRSAHPDDVRGDQRGKTRCAGEHHRARIDPHRRRARAPVRGHPRRPRPRHVDALCRTTKRRRRTCCFSGFRAVPLHHWTNDFDRRRDVGACRDEYRRLDNCSHYRHKRYCDQRM